MGGGVGGCLEEVTEGLVEFEGWEVVVEAETLLCIVYGGGHCDDKVRCRAGSEAEEAESAGSKAKLADEDDRG